MAKRCRLFAQVARTIGLATSVAAIAGGCADPAALDRREARAVDVKVKPAPAPPSSATSRPIDVKQITGDGITLPASVVKAKAPKEQSGFVFAADSSSPPETVPVPIPGSGMVRGRSTVTVAAPIERVREVVLGFASYPEFMPHYTSCRVLGRTPSGGRDVYMEVGAVHGAVKLWARVDVSKPALVDGVEVYTTKFLDGNVKTLDASWRLKKVDDASTQLTMEVFMNPKLPLPDSLLNKENLEGSRQAVLALKKRSEAQTQAKAD